MMEQRKEIKGAFFDANCNICGKNSQELNAVLYMHFLYLFYVCNTVNILKHLHEKKLFKHEMLINKM